MARGRAAARPWHPGGHGRPAGGLRCSSQLIDSTVMDWPAVVSHGALSALSSSPPRRVANIIMVGRNDGFDVLRWWMNPSQAPRALPGPGGAPQRGANHLSTSNSVRSMQVVSRSPSRVTVTGSTRGHSAQPVAHPSARHTQAGRLTRPHYRGCRALRSP